MHLLVFLTTVMRNGHSNYILITLIYMYLNAKQMSPYKQYKQCRYSVIFLTPWLKKREMRKMTFYIPSAKRRTKTPKTKHSPLSLVFPSVLLPRPGKHHLSQLPETNITSCRGQTLWSFDCAHLGNCLKRLLQVKVLVTQSCLTLYNAMNCSLPSSSVHGMPHARVLV